MFELLLLIGYGGAMYALGRSHSWRADHLRKERKELPK